MILAFQGGVLNIGGFMACHRFVSHVTGFATFFGYELSQSQGISALGILLVPLFFLFGAMISGQLVDTRLRSSKKPKYYIVFGVMLVLLIVVIVGGFNNYFGEFGISLMSAQGYLLLALLCLTCGLQNGTVTAVSKSVVRTTHLTGLTTDLGIGIVRVLNRKKVEASIPDEIRANKMRIGIIIFFVLGSAVGGLFFRFFGYRGFFLPAAITGCLFLITYGLQFQSRHDKNQ